MKLTGTVITVIICAIRTRTAVTETQSHTVDPRPGSDGHVRWRDGALGDSVVVSDRLQFTGRCLQTVPRCRQSR